jgi:two-component system sensor histidine kinase TctE
MQTDIDAMRAIVARLDGTAETTGRMIGQLLSLARSEPGRVLDEQDLDLTALAHDATFELLAPALAKEIDLGFEGTDPVMVRGERVLLRELVTNLVHNAVTYTPRGGRVTVSVGRAGGQACLRVVDDGPGIAPAERTRAFERFQRLASSTESGSGLGLAIVKEICVRHGAEIALADPPGGRGLDVQVRWVFGPG